MGFNGFEGTDGGAENVSEVSPSIEETEINDSMAEIDLPDLEPVEMQDEINEDAFESNESTYDEANFDDLVLEEPEIIEEDDGDDDVFGETSSGASKHAIIDALKESEDIEEPEEDIEEEAEEPEEALEEEPEELEETEEDLEEEPEEIEETEEDLEEELEEEAEEVEETLEEEPEEEVEEEQEELEEEAEEPEELEEAEEPEELEEETEEPEEIEETEEELEEEVEETEEELEEMEKESVEEKTEELEKEAENVEDPEELQEKVEELKEESEESELTEEQEENLEDLEKAVEEEAEKESVEEKTEELEKEAENVEDPEELQEKVEELKEESEESELTEEQEEKLENLEKTSKYLEQSEKETSEVEEKQNEIKENEDIIDEDLKDHLQSEYATYEDNLRFQDELSRQKEELLNSREEITAHKAEIEKMLEDETLTEEQRNELLESHTALEQQEEDLDTKIEKNSEQMEMLKVEEQEMRNISQYEMQGLNERVNGIVEEFEEQDASYEAAVNGENSEEFVDNCNETLNKLNEQKDIVQSAKDLKFQEIYEYVTKNEMERFDTEHDPYYQHLISEYRALLQQDEEIRSHVNTIDAQAMTVAYYQELPYDSQANINNPHPFHTSVYSDAELGIAKNVELPKEIAEGNDDPETTDYFVDEVRADKTMEKFCQGNWENLEPDEKKTAIEKLAEYNYDILGIKEPIKIEYYDKNVEGDYGGYDEKSNTLFINIRNLQNGPETADTVAHEMRHAYQHMRAGELETNRDLSFAINFSRYIKPEQNQSAYEQQIVEKDAALYAQRFKKYVESLDSTMEKSTDKTVENKADRAKNADYGKAATVDSSKVSDSIKKVKNNSEGAENKKLREVFETEEIERIKEMVCSHYENAGQIGKINEKLKFYKEHNNIETGHIYKTLEKTCETANDVEELFASDDFGGLYSPYIDRKTLQMAALYHDTGMDGNILAENYEEGLENYIKDSKEKNTEKKNKTDEELKKEYEDNFRNNHSLQSAIHVLRDREKIQSMGVDPDEVAIICFMHSKSCSGMKNLADGGGKWLKSFEKIENEVDSYNKKHPEETITFNKKCLCNEKGGIDEEKLARMRSSCICIRLGDADGHDHTTNETQGGRKIEIDEKTVNVDPHDVRKSRIEAKEQCASLEERRNLKTSLAQFEVRKMDIYEGGQKLTDENDESGIGRIYAVGEKNFKKLQTEVQTEGDKKVLVHSVELTDGNMAPYSTMYCLEERVKEMATFGSAPTPEGKKEGAYQSCDKINMKQVIHIGKNCSEHVKREYSRYAGIMYNKWKVRVEIKE